MLPRCAAVMVLAGATLAGAFDSTYSAYAGLLSAGVKGDGVRYTELSGKTAAISKVRQEFESVTAAQFAAFSEKQQIAFLINAYNFFTIDLILRNLPLKSGIRDISDPWKRPFILLFGQKVSLDHIEQDLLRKNYKEPRLHFALVCASKGCPALAGKPFLASTLGEQLARAGEEFLKDPRRNRIEGTTLYLSRIFEWYGADFDRTQKGGYRAYVAGVLGIDIDKYKVSFLEYDWALNSAP